MVGPVAIVGAGSIGVAWALVFARAGHPVRIWDPDPERLDVSAGDLDQRLAALERHGLLAETPAVIARRVSGTRTPAEALAGAVHVQECAPEQLELKRQLLLTLDDLAAPGTTIASSSSMLAPTYLAESVPGRSRILVAHPGNPPYLLPIVELVAAPFTSADAVDAVDALMSNAGMSPVRINGEPSGFVMNRLQGAVLREAYCLVRDGVIDVDGLDRVMRDGLGRRWSILGPFETADLNTRGGIAAHADRMGPGYAEMGAERGQYDPWTQELVRDVTRQRRELLQLEAWESRVLWRDEALMTLERARETFEPWPPAPAQVGTDHRSGGSIAARGQKGMR